MYEIYLYSDEIYVSLFFDEFMYEICLILH